MNAQNNSIISQITVRLKNKDNTVIGTGIIYYDDSLDDKVYILTASHCLFEDGDGFSQLREFIAIDIYNAQTNTYNPIIDKNIDSSLLYKDQDKDVALLIFEKDEILRMIGLDSIPPVLVVQERHSFADFVTKGFPRATKGKELDTLRLQHPREMTEVNKFQLETTSFYSDFNMEGFSGSGVFLLADNEIYLYGIFTRYRQNPEEKGRIIYCQYIELLNDILTNKYLTPISYTYVGENGLTRDFFQSHIEKSVSNLGGRFNQKLNFRLPIGQVFNTLSYNRIFKNRFLKIWDDWFTARHQSYNLEGDVIKDIKEQFYSLRENKILWLSQIKFNYRQELGVKSCKDEIQIFNIVIRNKIDELSELEFKEKNDSRKYQNERSWLIDILQINEQLLAELDSVDIELVNKPILIIKGDAGSGKSHLLGDIATERIKNNLPTLLLLGQHFHSAKTIEENVLNLLHLGCTFTELLINLDKISNQIGSRVLILIDAINEGAGSDLWTNQIAGFISSIEKYKGVGIALSIRSTYFDDIISKDFIEAESLHIIEHKGFKGNEYEALKLFCEYYSLKLPSFPILTPEFSNPLFLHLICNTVKELPDKTFPKGFNGLNKLYNEYIESLNEKFEKKNKKYKLRSIVSESIEVLATSILNSEFNSITIQEAVKLFDNKFSNHKTLLTDLIDENILIRNKVYSGSGKYHDAIYFAYQRLGDYFMAQKLLNGCASKKDVLDALKNPNGLGIICSDYDWKYRGIIEALSIILPEEFDLDIFEISKYFIANTDKKEERKTQHIYGWISRVELDSLKWRKVESINDEKITEWLQSKKAIIRNNDWFLCLTELSSIINHPFNSDRLTRILKKYPMPKRDSFWQEFINYYRGYDDNNIAFPIQRLIDWAWMPNISILSDDETAKLVSQTLAWLLSTTNTKLRDQTTKALVNLLEQKPIVLISLLKTFEDIDDFYISERLYAVAYGCILRTEKEESIKIIAKYVYDSIFKEKNPPVHVLLRDYARNTVEYAVYRNLLKGVNLRLIRPPYNSTMPKLPEKKEVEKLKIDFDNPNYKLDYSAQHNAIYYSLIDSISDFGHYVVESKVDDFFFIPFKEENKYKKIYKSLNEELKLMLKTLTDTQNKLERAYRFLESKKHLSLPEKSKQEAMIELLETTISLCETIVIEDINDEELSTLILSKIVPYLSKMEGNRTDYSLNPCPIRYWIIQRVFELGYDKKIHGQYDAYTATSMHRHENKIERIGKKYQWIAFHEIFAILSDNYKFKDGWREDRHEYFKGTWQAFLRDIDPATTTLNKTEEDSEEILDTNTPNEWWGDKDFSNWEGEDSSWVLIQDDLIQPSKIIKKVDEFKDSWLQLSYSKRWIEPKKLGEENYWGKTKQVWYEIEGYLVKTKDKDEIIKFLQRKNFWGRYMPEKDSGGFSSLINREKFWSPAYNDENQEGSKGLWDTLGGTRHKIMITDTVANGHIEDDKSGTLFSYRIPTQYIFDNMGLQYAPIDGDLKNKSGEIIATNCNPNGLMIKEKQFLGFLQKHDLDIIWTLLGERFSHSNKRDEESYYKVICGVYYLEDGKINGELKMYDRE